MFTTITAVVCLVIGVIVGQIYGRKLEQKAVGKVLADFSTVDRQARELVNRCYNRLSNGIKAELDKILPI